MTTHERALVVPVNLAIDAERRLNPEARGWCRHLLRTANRRGFPGRKKKWDYWSVQAGDLILSGVVANLDFLGTSDVWWLDMSTMTQGGRGVTVPGGRGFDLPERAGATSIRIDSKRY